MIITFDSSSSPAGLIWDGDNYSCAYSALLTILYEVWSNDTKAWTRRFKEINQHHLKSLSTCFKKYMNGQATFEKETLSDVNFTLRVLHNFPMEPEAQVFQLWHQQFLPLRILLPSQVLNVPIVNILNHPLMTD